jgi:hypothetical protein
LGATKVADHWPVTVPVAISIKELKSLLLASLASATASDSGAPAAHSALSESGFVLHRARLDVDEKDKILANEFNTLDKIKLAPTDFLWLEPGIVPIPGKITLEFFAFRAPEAHRHEKPLATFLHAETAAAAPAATAASAPAATPAPSAAVQTPPSPAETKEEVKSAGTSSSGSNAPDSATGAAAVAAASAAPLSSTTANRGSLTPLFALDFSSNATLGELKLALLLQLRALSSGSAAAAVASESTPTAAGAAATVIPAPPPSAAHLRVRQMTRSDQLSRLVAADSVALKKQSVTSDRRLALQILSAPEPASLTLSALLLRVLVARPLRYPPFVQYGPLPTYELAFDGGDTPALTPLLALLAAQTGIAATAIAVAKWFGARKAWALITDAEMQREAAKEWAQQQKQSQSQPSQPQQQQQQGKKGKGGGKGGKQASAPVAHLKGAPYYLHDDDLLLVIDKNAFRAHAEQAHADAAAKAAKTQNGTAPSAAAAAANGAAATATAAAAAAAAAPPPAEATAAATASASSADDTALWQALLASWPIPPGASDGSARASEDYAISTSSSKKRTEHVLKIRYEDDLDEPAPNGALTATAAAFAS